MLEVLRFPGVPAHRPPLAADVAAAAGDLAVAAEALVAGARFQADQIREVAEREVAARRAATDVFVVRTRRAAEERAAGLVADAEHLLADARGRSAELLAETEELIEEWLDEAVAERRRIVDEAVTERRRILDEAVAERRRILDRPGEATPAPGPLLALPLASAGGLPSPADGPGEMRLPPQRRGWLRRLWRRQS